MSLKTLQQKPGHLIRRVQQIAVALFMEECTAFDITPVQYATMVAISENPGADATRISAAIAFDRSTLGDVLERLEARGIVRRTGSKNDKRVKILELTRAGKELLEAVEPAVERTQTRILAPLKTADRKKLLAFLQQVLGQ